jgi:prophage regulatory protein
MKAARQPISTARKADAPNSTTAQNSERRRLVGVFSFQTHHHHGALNQGDAAMLNSDKRISGAAEDNEPLRFLLKKEVLAIVRVSWPTLWKWIREGKFPSPVCVGEKSVWFAQDVFQWMRTRPTRLYKGMSGA